MYNPDMDKQLRTWSFNETGLMVSIHQYKDGHPKLQIGPRYILRKDKTTSICKAGRLSNAELKWLGALMEEITEEMDTLEREL